jgi:hypothetical protein
VFLKLAAFAFQAVLPAAVVTIIAHLTALPRSEWQWVEYSFAAVLVGFASIIATAMIWRVLEWLHNLAVRRYTDHY